MISRLQTDSNQKQLTRTEEKVSKTIKETATTSIQLFRERLSEKVHATITKGIVGGFEFAVLQRNLKEWHKRPWAYVCVC